MRVAIKLAVSVAALVFILLGVAAGIELSLGERKPALINLITLAIMAPVLFAIWRR